MLQEGMTRLIAAHRWVNGFNAVPTAMIEKLCTAYPDEWHEATHFMSGDRVYVYDAMKQGRIIEVKDQYKIELDNGDVIWRDTDRFEVLRDYPMPIWGTMWSFSDSCDIYWLENENGLELMSQCGFRIFENDDFGFYFGIDGAGYDFYESHWLPLYEKRGLNWHDLKNL